jgi:hypothetical protein
MKAVKYINIYCTTKYYSHTHTHTNTRVRGSSASRHPGYNGHPRTLLQGIFTRKRHNHFASELYIYVYVCVCVYIYICMYMYVYIYIYIYMCICLCMYVCVCKMIVSFSRKYTLYVWDKLSISDTTMWF